MAPGGIYVLIGPDRPRKHARVDALSRALGVDWLDRRHLEAAEASPRACSSLLREVPAAGPVRMVVMEDAARLSAPCARALSELASRLPDTTCLVLLLDDALPAAHPLAPLLALATIERLPGGSGGEPSGRGAGSRGGFGLIEAVIRRNAGEALALFHEQLGEGKDALEVLGLLMWQLQRWLVIAEGVQAALSRDQLLRLGGLQEWQLDRLLGEVKTRPPAWARQMLRRCWAMDVAAKTGRVPMLTAAVEQVIIELCRPAPTGGASVGPGRSVTTPTRMRAAA